MWHSLAKRLGKGLERLVLSLQNLVAVTEGVLLDQLELVADHLVRDGFEFGQELIQIASPSQTGWLRDAMADGGRVILQETRRRLAAQLQW